jgi:acyl dehydratase
MSLYFDDYRVGEVADYGAHEFTREAILAFAADYDPQPFHLDEAAAKASLFGALSASGWHTCSVAAFKRAQWRHQRLAETAARGETLPPQEILLGVKDLRWLRPVLAGDVLAFSGEVVGRRETRRAQWGLVQILNKGANQKGELTVEFTSSMLVGRKAAAK